ncbi:MAG: hypothetical protein ACOC3G_08145 [Phycisphaeraceae bacterium]
MSFDDPQSPDIRLRSDSAKAVDTFLAAHAAGRSPRAEPNVATDEQQRVRRLFALLEHDGVLGEMETDKADFNTEASVNQTLRRCRAERLAQSITPARLNPDDAAALDALLVNRARGNAKGPRPAGSADRTAVLSDLLHLLDLDQTLDDAQDHAASEDDLTRRTLERCRQGRQQQRFNQQIAMVSQGPATPRNAPWRQVMTAAGLVLIGLSLLLPALQHNQKFVNRVVCATNLGTAGEAIASYSADHDGKLPRAPMAAGGTWWNVGANGENGEVKSNSAHLYLLVRQGYIDPDQLACPTNAHADDVQLTRKHRDWLRPEQVSFSFHNVSGGSIRLVSTPDLALLADKNPLFIATAGRVTFDHDASPDTPSRAHGGTGQNVLRADGIVIWTIRPVLRKHDLFSDDPLDADDDNIWVAAGVKEYDGDEQPASSRDSFLVP